MKIPLFSYMSKKFNSMNEATEHMNTLISAGYRDLSMLLKLIKMKKKEYKRITTNFSA